MVIKFREFEIDRSKGRVCKPGRGVCASESLASLEPFGTDLLSARRYTASSGPGALTEDSLPVVKGTKRQQEASGTSAIRRVKVRATRIFRNQLHSRQGLGQNSHCGRPIK